MMQSRTFHVNPHINEPRTPRKRISKFHIRFSYELSMWIHIEMSHKLLSNEWAYMIRSRTQHVNPHINESHTRIWIHELLSDELVTNSIHDSVTNSTCESTDEWVTNSIYESVTNSSHMNEWQTPYMIQSQIPHVNQQIIEAQTVYMNQSRTPLKWMGNKLHIRFSHEPHMWIHTWTSHELLSNEEYSVRSTRSFPRI